jgi:hypothetical protein
MLHSSPIKYYGAVAFHTRVLDVVRCLVGSVPGQMLSTTSNAISMPAKTLADDTMPS